MKYPIELPDMKNWTEEQALAVYEVCQTISATLMHHHKADLIDKMLEIEQRCCDNSLLHNPNFELPF